MWPMGQHDWLAERVEGNRANREQLLFRRIGDGPSARRRFAYADAERLARRPRTVGHPQRTDATAMTRLQAPPPNAVRAFARPFS